ncbi:hypothetical protein GCM10022221_10980 [Actinocorallia aurea]
MPDRRVVVTAVAAHRYLVQFTGAAVVLQALPRPRRKHRARPDALALSRTERGFATHILLPASGLAGLNSIDGIDEFFRQRLGLHLDVRAAVEEAGGESVRWAGAVRCRRRR